MEVPSSMVRPRTFTRVVVTRGTKGTGTSKRGTSSTNIGIDVGFLFVLAGLEEESEPNDLLVSHSSLVSQQQQLAEKVLALASTMGRHVVRQVQEELRGVFNRRVNTRSTVAGAGDDARA